MAILFATKTAVTRNGQMLLSQKCVLISKKACLLQPHSYGSSQTMSSNHNAVLISSTSNTLMSASVKPTSQQIGAIGSKGGFQTSQPSTAVSCNT